MNGPGVIRPRQRTRNPAVPSYTIIAVGQRCVGKSSLLRLLLDTLPLSPHATHDQLRSVATFVSSPDSFCECHLEVLWDNERLLLHLIDTPPLNGGDTLADIISVVEERYIRGAQSDTDDGDAALGESHVHLCLYLLDALQPDFRHDINLIGRLSVRVNVLPILARSDVLTLSGLINFKQSIRARLADAGLGFGIFDKQGEAGVITARQAAIESPRNLPLLPYAIFTPEHSKLAYEPILNLWMDRLDKRRVESQPSDSKMDIDRKMDEPTSSSSSSSSSVSVGRHLTKPASSREGSSPAPASEPDPTHKSDPEAVTQANDSSDPTPFSTTPARPDDKSQPQTPPITDPSASAQSSSPQPSALKDNFGTVRINSEAGQQAPNPEDGAAVAHIEAEVQNADNLARPKSTATTTERSLSASSPRNGFHSDIKVSPSINTIPLNPKTSPAEVPEQKNQNLKCDAGFQNAMSSVSNNSELVLEKFVRVMRWGVLDCIDNRQSDFVCLRDEIMSWRKELKAYTREYLYSRFKDDSFSRLAQQQQQPHQRDPLPSTEPLPPSRHDNIIPPRDAAYRVSPPPPPPPSSLQHGHGLRDRSTSFTESAAERDRPHMSRSLPPQYSGGRDHDTYAYERDFGHRYPYHDRPRDKYPSPEREKDYHAPPPPPHLSPHASTVMPLSNERKHSVSNGDRDRDRPKYRDPIKHDHDWEEQQRHHPVLPSIDRGDRYPRVSPITHAPPLHCHPGPYPPQYGSDHIRDKDHFERDRVRPKISPSMRERDMMITPPLQRPGSSPGASVTPVVGSQHGQGYGPNMVNPNISPTISSGGGKQLDVPSLLNHNGHHGMMEKEWERRERERELSPNSAALQSASGVSLGMPISNMPMSAGPQAGNVVSSANNLPPGVPNVASNSTGRKRKITMACNFCRSRKLKCDGLKPACGQCTKRGNTCDYQQHAVASQGPSGIPKDGPLASSQSRDHLAGQPNAILPPTHVSGGQLASPGLRHREREYGREMERDRDGSFYHSGRPYSPPPPPMPPQTGSSQSHGHPYPQQGYPSSNYSRMREGSPPPQHQANNAHGATHTWRYTSQSHAQAHAAATRDSDVDELMEDLSEHEERNSDVRSRGMKSTHRDFTHVVYEQANGGVMNSSSSTNGRGRVSVDMLIVEALGEGGSSSNGPLDDDRTGPAAIGGANGGRNRDGVKDSEKAQQHASQPPNQNQPPSGQGGGHYESGSWYEMSVGVIDVGSEGDKKKRLNRQSANYGSKAVACVHCRARKTRCDAVRPACGNCARRSLACSYNHTTPSQPRSKGKKAAAAAAAASSNSNSGNSNPGSAMTPNGVMDHDMKHQRSNLPPHPSRSPNHSRSPGQIGTPHPLPNWHHASQSRQSHPHSHPHPHSHSHPSSSHSPIRVDDHRLPIEESAERERPLTRSPQPPIATLNVPERSRSRSSSSGSLSTSLMENGPVSSHPNGNTGPIAVSRSRSTSNFSGPTLPELAGAKRKSPDVAELMDTSMDRGIIPDERNRERPDKRRKPWVENASGDAAHLSNQVRVQ